MVGAGVVGCGVVGSGVVGSGVVGSGVDGCGVVGYGVVGAGVTDTCVGVSVGSGVFDVVCCLSPKQQQGHDQIRIRIY